MPACSNALIIKAFQAVNILLSIMGDGRFTRKVSNLWRALMIFFSTSSTGKCNSLAMDSAG